MNFRILGPLEVESEGRAIEIAGRQPRALLALLLLNPNQVVSRDRLVESLWGEHGGALWVHRRRTEASCRLFQLLNAEARRGM